VPLRRVRVGMYSRTQGSALDGSAQRSSQVRPEKAPFGRPCGRGKDEAPNFCSRGLFALRTRLTDRHDLDGIRLVVDLRTDIRCSLRRSFSASWVHRFVAASGGNHSYLGVTRWRTQAAPHWYNAFERC